MSRSALGHTPAAAGRKRSRAIRELRTSIEIGATPQRVWQVLTDFAAYLAWNPLIQRAEGEARVGARLTLRAHLSGGPSMTFRPRVLVAEAPRELRWVGHLLVSGLFDGEHSYLVEELGPGRSRFTQAETFTGVLVPLLAWVITKTGRGFEEMNGALKARAEGTGPLP